MYDHRPDAEYLLATSPDTSAINGAIASWKRNFPFNEEPLTFRLSAVPRTERQAEAIEQAAAAIPWIADVRLGRSVSGGREQWVLGAMIRRGVEVDVRDVTEAVRRSMAN